MKIKHGAFFMDFMVLSLMRFSSFLEKSRAASCSCAVLTSILGETLRRATELHVWALLSRLLRDFLLDCLKLVSFGDSRESR